VRAAPGWGLVASHNRQGQPSFLRTHSAGAAPADLEDYPVARRDHTAQHLHQYYLDQVAKVPWNFPKQLQQLDNNFCGTQVIAGHDQDFNGIGKRLWCGREWCAKCREPSHNRRIARWLTKVQQISSMGYWVITFPQEVRPLLHSASALRSLRNKLDRVLKELGYDRGMARWHFKGDQDDCYHPHLNAIVDGNFLAPQELDRRKQLISRKLLKRSIATAIGKELEIKYLYSTRPKKMYTWLKYITRPTFLEYSWDPVLADNLYRFRNNHTWGKWDQSPKWHLTHRSRSIRIMTMVEQGLHPISGKPLTWDRKPTPLSFILAQGAIEIAPGYYLIPAPYPPRKTRASPDRGPPANLKA